MLDAKTPLWDWQGEDGPTHLVMRKTVTDDVLERAARRFNIQLSELMEFRAKHAK